ncbi:matrix-remodeling-associated protein 5-like [Megalops cyprinoides]|uniref:matrix-remodeling-associated protein 5-like n=1 Tax=Megalops cyprinoides TaxID=118141 RepID=UPI001864A9DE|nr:matrix-remodeling-associated protein 5-like [Megalops cyprinoides]
MGPLGIPHAWAVTVLDLLLALPLVLHACPRSCSCPDPREVHCTFSHLTHVPHSLPRGTQRLNLGYNNIMTLNASEFTGLRRLEMLMLHGNDIESVSPGSFYNLRSLRILKLSHNKLRTLTHTIFEGLSSLARLHLDHNAIEFIEPFSFSGLTALTVLNLEGNRLRGLHPHTFITLSFLGNFWSSGLRHLHLSDNQLEYLLPGTLQNLNKLEALSLHGNPWACDCNLQWLSQWNNKNKGVIKCKKEDHSGTSENCAMCSTPQTLNNSQVFHLSPEQLSCDRPLLHSPLKLRESTMWQDTDSDIPYTKDLEPPLGHLTFMLSDSHGNTAYVACVVRHQSEGTAMTWQNLKFPGQVAVNVTLMSLLECAIEKDELQELWRLIAYYYEFPAVLKRGLRQENTSTVTFQYSQVFSEDSPYLTHVKGHLMAEPAWLLQPLIRLKLNRRKTTSKTLVLNFHTFISSQLNTREEPGFNKYTWAFIQRWIPGRIQAASEGSEVSLECKVSSSGHVHLEWMLPDLSIVNKSHSRVMVSESGKLVIDKASPSDSGLYHCLVRTETDLDVVSFRLIVREKMLTPDHINGKEMSIDKGRSLTLPCSVSSVQPTIINWYMPTNIVMQQSSSNSRINILSNGSLVITNATHEDSGKYSCLAANLYGADILSHQVMIKGENKSEQMSARSFPLASNGLFSTARGHSSHWGLQKLNKTLPSPNLIGSGDKPRISSFNTTSQSALIETDVYLPCEALGDPKPVFSWTKVSTGVTIEENRKLGQRFEVLSNGTFVIKNVKLQDRGQYICLAKNMFGSDKMIITLSVLTQPPKIVPPKSTNISVYLGHPVHIDCVAEGKPQAQIIWILPDRTLAQGLDLPDTAFVSNGTLRIKAANLSSKGNYKCIASNAAGADTVTYNIHVVAELPTINEEASEDIVMPMGSNAYIHCTAKGEPKPILQWNLLDRLKHKSSQLLNERISVFSNGTLFLRNISLTDSGKYECSATNQAGTSRRVVQLNIRQQFLSPEHKLAQQYMVTAKYGSTMYLHCPESENSQHGTRWKLPSNILLDHRNSPDRRILAFGNGTLRIQKLTEMDGGSYLCMFRQWNHEDVKQFQIEILMKPPKIKRLATAQKRVTYGKNFQVDCLASGIPNPEMFWILPDGTIINNTLQPNYRGALSGRYVIFENGTLLVQQLTQRDEGDYTCYARNNLGKDEMKISVKVIPGSPRILSEDQMIIWGRLGEPAYLRCEATGDPLPTITWFSPSNATITSIRYQILGDGTLIIRKVGLEDRGNYTCVARNSAGNDIKIMQLEVVSREPQINGLWGTTTAKVSAPSHQTLLLDCEAEGLPEPRVTWTTSYGISLPTPYLGGRFQVHKNGSLDVRALRKTDEGQFVCLAQNSFGEARLEIELKVQTLTEKPSFSKPNTEIIPIKTGMSEVTLQCFAHGKPVPEFLWVLPNSTALIPGTILQRFHHYPGNGILRILQPVNGDMGVYRCLANNTAGQAEKHYALEPGWKPQIQSTPRPIRILFGQNLNLPCSVDAWPQAAISWSLPNGRVLEKPQVIGRVSFLGNGTLQLREAAAVDKGIYICKATNVFGSSILSYPVTVIVHPPQITNVFPSVTTVSRGSMVKLSCRAVGTPKPDVSWTLPGSTTLTSSTPIATQSGIYVTVDGILVIQNPVLTNSGIYKCNARSALGIDFKATYLQVL